jgi:Uma2 family endonuclease
MTMVATTGTAPAAGAQLTAQDVWNLPEDERGELIAGEFLPVPPVDADHGDAVGGLVEPLRRWAREQRPGVVGSEIGFAPPGDPPTLLAPDVSYYPADRLPPRGRRPGFTTAPPVLAVEVLSPGNSASDIAEKVDLYLTLGVEVVWVVDPRRAAVVAHTPDGLARRLAMGDVLEGGAALPGFALPLAELFA